MMQAKSGQIAGLAVIMSMGPDNVTVASAGGYPASIIMGCEQMKRVLLKKLFAHKKSPILVPGRMI